MALATPVYMYNMCISISLSLSLYIYIYIYNRCHQQLSNFHGVIEDTKPMSW